MTMTEQMKNNATGKRWGCKECRKEEIQIGFGSRKELIAHYKAKHPDREVVYRGGRTPKAALDQKNPEPGTVEAVYAAEKVLRDHVKGLDSERERLQARLLELDNIIAKYRKI